jgi:hypothetical protein
MIAFGLGDSMPGAGSCGWDTGRGRVGLAEAGVRRPTALRSVSHAAFHSKRASDASDSDPAIARAAF